MENIYPEFSLKVMIQHKNDFIRPYPQFSEVLLPAVFKEQNNQIIQIITAEQLIGQHTLEDLKKLVL